MRSNMQRGKDYDFGEITCFLVGKPKKSEKKRYVVVSKDNKSNLFLELYKDRNGYLKKFKGKEESVLRAQLDSIKFCGIIQGNLNTRNAKGESKPGAAKSYLALIFFDFTAMLMFSESDLKRICLQELEVKIAKELGHTKTKAVTVDSAPHLDDVVSPRAGKSILMSLTKERLSLACQENHHRCCRSWPLADIRVDDTVPTSLQIDVIQFGTYSFTSSRSSIFEEVRVALYTNEQSINPYCVTRGPPAPFRRPSVPSTSSSPPPSLPPRAPPYIPDILPYLPSEPDEGSDQFSLYMTPEQQPDLDFEYCIDWNETIAELKQMGANEPLAEEDYLTTDPPDHRRPSIPLTQTMPNFLRQASEPVTIAGSMTSIAQSVPEDLGHSFDRPELRVRRHSLYPPERDSQIPPHGYLIYRTLEKVLRGFPSSRDTLQLSHSQRVRLCIQLYGSSTPTGGSQMEPWEILAHQIGLRVEAVRLISSLVRNHRLPIPAAEVVLRHWQYVYNKYGCTGPGGKCPYHCNREQLLYILRHHVQRDDLVKLVENGAQQLSACSSTSSS